MNKAQKNISRLICSLLIFSHSALYDHGFAAETLVQLNNDSWQIIDTLCHKALHDVVSITSYDMNALRNIDHYVKNVGQSKSNCYIQLSFDSGCNGAPCNTIKCSPTQEFYVPALNKWVPAYTLTTGDALLSKNNSEKFILYIEFVEKPLKTYTLEVQESHTFFVGKDAILTHNIVLPIAFSLGFTVPFGSATAGSAGSFFGPIGIMGGMVIGGIISIAIKIARENHIPRYKTPKHDIDSITTHRQAMQRIEEVNSVTKQDGCFSPSGQSEIVRVHIFPITDPLPQAAIGCIEIEFIPKEITKGCFPAPEIETINDNGCFDPTQHNDLPLFNALEKAPATENVKGRYQGAEPEKKRYDGPLYARTEDWIKDHPFGQKIKDVLERSPYTNQGKRAFKIIKKIEEYDGFDKGDYVVVDAMHQDHLEVFGKSKKWKHVANFDGTKNEKKTEQGREEPRQPLQK